MARVALFLIDGFEEVEAVSTIDILRRGGVEVQTVSLMPGLDVKGSHDIQVKADSLLKDLAPQSFDLLAIPGGTIAYLDHKGFMAVIEEAGKRGQKLAAICAAPSVLGALGILKGKKAACYPGFEERLPGATIVKDPVVTDGNVTTSRGPSTALPFALEILRILAGDKAANKVRDAILLAA